MSDAVGPETIGRPGCCEHGVAEDVYCAECEGDSKNRQGCCEHGVAEDVYCAQCEGGQVPPQQMTMEDNISPTLQKFSKLCSENSLLVEQKLGLLEAITGGACEQSNQFKISNESGAHILSAREASGSCSRCCCAPFHSTIIYISEASTDETLLTLERQGMDCPCPKKCLGCCVCCECCADGITVYEGRVEGDPGELQDSNEPLAVVKQPIGGGGCRPVLDVFRRGDMENPAHKIEGPHCFGGCSELCCKSTFKYTNAAEGHDVAEIVHLTPQTCCEVCETMTTDVDNFRISYQQSATVTERASALAAALLVDYMFFEMDNGMCACKGGNSCECTLFFCYCCGMLCPCKIKCSKDGGGDGGGGGGQDTE